MQPYGPSAIETPWQVQPHREPRPPFPDLVHRALRSAIPGYTLDEVFDNKDLIAQNVKDSVTELMAGYGYDIITTLITNIELPKDVERSMNAINSA